MKKELTETNHKQIEVTRIVYNH